MLQLQLILLKNKSICIKSIISANILSEDIFQTFFYCYLWSVIVSGRRKLNKDKPVSSWNLNTLIRVAPLWLRHAAIPRMLGVLYVLAKSKKIRQERESGLSTPELNFYLQLFNYELNFWYDVKLWHCVSFNTPPTSTLTLWWIFPFGKKKKRNRKNRSIRRCWNCTISCFVKKQLIKKKKKKRWM